MPSLDKQIASVRGAMYLADHVASMYPVGSTLHQEAVSKRDAFQAVLKELEYRRAGTNGPRAKARAIMDYCASCHPNEWSIDKIAEMIGGLSTPRCN